MFVWPSQKYELYSHNSVFMNFIINFVGKDKLLGKSSEVYQNTTSE